MKHNVSDKSLRCPRPVVIVGPTAVGKTSVGITVANRVGGDIISADSMAVYKGMDIGTAKPDVEEQASARFHMIDVVEPDQPYTVVDFAQQATSIIGRLLSEGRTPILLGGTGLYVRAVVDGLDIPAAGANSELRERLLAEARDKGNEALFERLSLVDAATALRLHANDLRRVVRALEVYEETGVPISVMHSQEIKKLRYPDAVWFGLTMERDKLYARIEERIDRMIRLGLIDEVNALLVKGYDVSLPSMLGLGYKEILGYLRGDCSLEESIYLMKRNTRRYAKRQLTWFRPNRRIQWIDVEGKSVSQVAEIIEEKLL